MDGQESDSSQRKSTLGVSVLFEMNNDLVIDKVDRMYNKLGPYKTQFEKNKDARQEYIILEGGFYTGFTQDNIPEGCGSLLLNTGQIYEGFFKMGQIQGKGRMIDLDGTAYEGNWKRNDIRGEGKIIWLDGKVYEGKIRKIKPHGFGTLKFPDSSIYKGRFVKGSMHGNGLLIWANSKVYAGEWRRSEMNGFGGMHWSNKCLFGSFKSGEIHGIGKMEWNDGRIYLGEWEKGYRHGLGIMIEPEKVSEGQWENDEFTIHEKILGQKLEKMIEQLEEKLKELKNDENLEKYLQFSLAVTIDQEIVSELQEEPIVESESEDFEPVSESFWSIEHLKNQEHIVQEREPDEYLHDQSSISDSHSSMQVHIPELHLSESVSIDSDHKQDNKVLESSSSDSKEIINQPELIIDESYSIPSTKNKVGNSHVDVSIPSNYSELPINQPILHKSELDSVNIGLPTSSIKSSSKLGKKSKKSSSRHESEELVIEPESRIESQNIIHKPFIELPDGTYNSFRDSDDYSLPQLKMMKEFTLEPSFTSAPLLIHAPQVVVPQFEEVNISLEHIEEVNESLHEFPLNQSIQTVFEEESEIQIEVEEFILPARVDMNHKIKTKETHNKKISSSSGRLEKVLVVKNDPTGKAVPMKTSISQNPPAGDFDYFESKDRQLLEIISVKEDFESVIQELQDIELPLDPEKFATLFEIRELLQPFDYNDSDQEHYSGNLHFIDWQEDNDLVYFGQIDSLGNRQGMGIEITPTGLYEGYWRANKRHGLGRLITIEGDNFEGFWRFDYKRGFGTLWKYIGEGYIGDWDFDTPEGQGTEISSLEIYEGTFHYGLRHGKGTLTQTNLTYTGEFFEGLIHGYGVVQWNNGSAYAGIFINGESKGLKGAFIPAYKKIEYKPRVIKKSNKPLMSISENESKENSESEESEKDGKGENKDKTEITDKSQDSDMSENSEKGKNTEDGENTKKSRGSDFEEKPSINEEPKKVFSLNVIPNPEAKKETELKFVKSKINETKVNEEKANEAKIKENSVNEEIDNQKLNTSQLSEEKKHPLGGGWLNMMGKRPTKSPSFHSIENSKLDESVNLEKELMFPDATKGIVKSPNKPKISNIAFLEGLKFSDSVKDYDDEELQRRKAKFKLANKEKGVENILKKDKKKAKT